MKLIQQMIVWRHQTFEPWTCEEKGTYLKKTLNLTPAPEGVVLTISPVTRWVSIVAGNVIFIAISSPMKKRWPVFINAPPELILQTAAWKSPSQVWHSAVGRIWVNLFRPEFLSSLILLCSFLIKENPILKSDLFNWSYLFDCFSLIEPVKLMKLIKRIQRIIILNLWTLEL